ncbi:MAG TPA: hypothetical protein VLB85_09655 [Acidimicrobiia bacterium]|nr:hypothetical protein [Acidimicrobiia bacterium]
MQEYLGSVLAVLRRFHQDERGLNTAELMGNAALAIGALVVIWAALEVLGVDVVNWIRGQLLAG